MLCPTAATIHEVNHAHELKGPLPRYGAFRSSQTHLSFAETLQAQKGPFQRGVLSCQTCNLLEDTCTKQTTIVTYRITCPNIHRCMRGWMHTCTNTPMLWFMNSFKKYCNMIKNVSFNKSYLKPCRLIFND